MAERGRWLQQFLPYDFVECGFAEIMRRIAEIVFNQSLGHAFLAIVQLILCVIGSRDHARRAVTKTPRTFRSVVLQLRPTS
jgi:hypothetical protein